MLRGSRLIVPMDAALFTCSKCDKSYTRKNHLLRHQLTHTNQLSASCPICKKRFQKAEVARRHSKICAKKHNQPIPPAARAGRKKLSCDECFFARVACDKLMPCSRCRTLGNECSLGKSTQSNERQSTYSAIAIASSTATTMRAVHGYELMSSEKFHFLLRFTDPSVKRDRLAIADTAGCSLKGRNMRAIYQSLEDVLSPDIPLEFIVNDPIDPALLTLNAAIAEDDNYLSEFFSHNIPASSLPKQLHRIATELIETSRYMGIENGDSRTVLDIAELERLFTGQNLSVFITAFFNSLHWYMPIVHCPTFDPAEVSDCLLLAIFLSGAAYTVTFNDMDLPPTLLTVAEEYIFRKISNLSTSLNPVRQYPFPSLTIETVQAALIIQMLQFSQGDPPTRRRIRVIRHPCLVSTVRSLGLFSMKRRMAPAPCEEQKWRELVEEEICIRIACWASLADGFLTVCFKNHPSISIFEMDCDFPWSTELFEAEDILSFNEIVASYAIGHSLPSLRKVASDLLQMPSNIDRMTWHSSLSVEHLLILIYAMNSLAFQARSGLLGYMSMDTIKVAARNWKALWEPVLGYFQSQKSTMSGTTTRIEQNLHLGYPKHAEELWWLLMTTLDMSDYSNGRKFQYLDSGATDDLGKLNEFIQFVSPRKN